MTEQPKFQRRKRRGADAPVHPPKDSPVTADRTLAELEALIAEKEALLQHQAELEAERKRAEKEAKARAAKAAAEVEAKAQEAARQREAKRRQQEAQRAAQQQADAAAKSAPKTPLVLATAPAAKTSDPEQYWQSIDRFRVDEQRLAARHVVTALREDPSHTRFDILRTRMLQALADNGWKRVAITSPTKDCGKTFTAANLAVSLSRQENCRTVLLDFDMRNPSLHRIFGVSDTGAIGDMLRGGIAPENHVQGFARNSISAGSHVAIGFNGQIEPYAAELLQDPSTKRVLNDIEAKFAPDVMLFDLPPALLNDDVIAMRPHVDALLIVAAGGVTKAKDIKETERRLGDNIPLLGVVLNKAEHIETGDYTY